MEEKGMVKYEAKDGQQVTLSFEIIKKYLVQGKSELVTVPEMMFFMGVCKSRGLNPFIKDCYLIKYDPSPAAIITSIDYFRKRAKAQRDCKGWQSGIIVERDGKLVYSKGIMLESDTLLGGWFKAKPEGWDEPCEKEVNLKGYIKRKKDGGITKFWAPENQPSQIEKVALSQGLRECWPDEFQQLYTPEEMGQPDTFKASEDVIQKQTADLTNDIKAGGTPPEGATVYKAEEITEPGQEAGQEQEQQEEDLKPDLFKRLRGARPGSDAKKKEIFKKTCEDNREEIESWKQNQPEQYIYVTEKYQKATGEPFGKPQEDTQEPSGEQNSGSGGKEADNSGQIDRIGFYGQATEAKKIFAEAGKVRLYMGVLSDFNCETMNDIPAEKEAEFIKALHGTVDQMNAEE